MTARKDSKMDISEEKSDFPELKTYHGSCHCTLFRFTLTVPELTTVFTCSCKYCTRNAHLWVFPVAENQLAITQGSEKALHSYEFAMKGTQHLFCPECGSSVIARRRDADPDKSLRINAQTINGLDITALTVRSFARSSSSSSPVMVRRDTDPMLPIPAKSLSGVDLETLSLENYEGSVGDVVRI